MLKLKDGVELKDLEKYGIRKHRTDKEFCGRNVVASKWSREWVCGDCCPEEEPSQGWEFYPILEIVKLNYWGQVVYKVEIQERFCFMKDNTPALDIIYKLIKDDLVEYYDYKTYVPKEYEQ